MYEYDIINLGAIKSPYSKKKDLLNKKSKEGWEVINIAPNIALGNSGMLETKMVAFLRKKSQKVING